MYYFVFDGRGILMDVSESYPRARKILDALSAGVNPPKLEIYSKHDFLPIVID